MYIELFQIPCACPIDRTKKDVRKSTTFCVDCKKLDYVTQKDSYALPLIDDTLYSLSGANWFSTLDVSGCWQEEMHSKDKEQPAFTSGNALWHFNIMPFGFSSAAVIIKRLMDTVKRHKLEDLLGVRRRCGHLGKKFRRHPQKGREGGCCEANAQ